MIRFYIPEYRLEEAQKEADKLGAKLTTRWTGASFSKICNIPLVEVIVEAIQPENLPVLVAYAHVDGERHTFTKDWEWTEQNVGTLSFSHCDRCHTHHNRTKVYIVKIAGALQQVGGHCAKELNCELKMRNLLKLKNQFEDFREEFSCGSSERYEDLEEWLRLAAVVCRHMGGYISKKVSEINLTPSTLNIVAGLLHPVVHCQEQQLEQDEYRELTKSLLSEEEKQNGYWISKCLEYLEQQEFSEYIHNCKVAILSGKEKLLPFAVSVVGQLLKGELERKVKFVRTETPNTGDKIVVKGSIAKILVDENRWGTNLKVTIDDERYGKVWLRTTAAWAYNAKIADKIECIINVKEVKDNIIFTSRASKVVVG